MAAGRNQDDYARFQWSGRRAWRAACACAPMLGCGLSPGALSAAEPAGSFPTKPVRLIVAQGIGSSVDTISRIIGTQLGEAWGRQVITDNRPGAGGIIGAEIASRAAPDGYTLLVSSTAMQVISPQVYKIYSTLNRVMKDPVTREHLARQGADPITSTPEEMLKFIGMEYGRFAQAIKLAGLTMQ